MNEEDDYQPGDPIRSYKITIRLIENMTIENKDIEEELKKMPKFKTYKEIKDEEELKVRKNYAIED